MRTIQMTLDDELVAAVDVVVKKLKTTRSAFARKALKEAIRQVNIEGTISQKRGSSGTSLSLIMAVQHCLIIFPSCTENCCFRVRFS